MGDDEIDMVGLFYKLANAEQEGKDATLDRKKITMALKVLNIHCVNVSLYSLNKSIKLIRSKIIRLLGELEWIDCIYFPK